LISWKYVLLMILAGVDFGCSSSGIRGDEFREKWLKDNLYNDEVKHKKAEPDVYENYEVRIAVLIPEKNMEGDEWNNQRRRSKANLRLYELKGLHSQNMVCEKSQAVSMKCETLMRLEGEQNLNFRLVDVETGYSRVEYGGRYSEDQELQSIREKPLAQLDFVFEGQGKYLKNSGGATFVFTFKKL
jgi:hypothetical protein